MPDAIWYYADGDEERGPVTESQIRSLIGSGAITRDELVWKEGMDDWVPAAEVPGLWDSAPPAPPVESAAAGSQQSSARADRAAAKPRATAAQPKRPPVEISKLLEGVKPIPIVGRGVLITGFLIVLLCRGCDSMSVKYAERVKAKSAVVELQFQDEWERARSVIEKQQQRLREEGIATAEDRTRMTELNEQMLELNGERQKELEDLRRGKWRELTTAARDAKANQAISSYWREIGFWLGAFAFSVGLWTVGLTGRSSERWLCLVMLAVIVYSLFLPQGGAG
jgi:hypothetical protein